MNVNRNQQHKKRLHKTRKTKMNEHRNKLYWNSYCDCCFLASMKEINPLGTCQKKRKKLAWMYTETSSGKILMIVASWYTWKKTCG